jgi:DNA-binding response OmpR family regulator
MLVISGKNILAVDDAELVLHVLRNFLQNTSYNLTCTTSANIALNFLKTSKPNLFILDIDMPEMSGYDLAMRIRAEGQEAPIIFLTGNTTQESVEKALMIGVADYIAKPISKTKLLERIHKLLPPAIRV